MTTTASEPQTQAQTRRFVVNHTLSWKARRKERGDEIHATPEEVARPTFQSWTKYEWVSELKDGEEAVPKALAGGAAPIPRAVLGESSPAAGPATVNAAPVPVQMVPVLRIKPDPTQPRKDFAEESMKELVDSIKQIGVEQAILVRPMSRWRQIVTLVALAWAQHTQTKDAQPAVITVVELWAAGIVASAGEVIAEGGLLARLVAEGRAQRTSGGFLPTAGALEPLRGETTLPDEDEWLEIVYGERRWRGAQLAGLTEIPAKVRELTDVEAVELQAIENLDRADLNPMEEAHQYEKMRRHGCTMERIMEVTGRAKNTIHGKLKLLRVPQEVRAAVIAGTLPAVTAERIGRLEGEVQVLAAQAILHPEGWQTDGEKVLSDRRAQEAIRRAEEKVEKQRKLDQYQQDATAAGQEWIVEDSKRFKEIHGQHGGEPKSGSGLMRLSDHVRGDAKYRTYAQILGQKSFQKAAKDLKPVAATTWCGELRQLFRVEDVKAALAAGGYTPKTDPDRSAAEAEEKAKLKAREKAMRTVLERSAEHVVLRSQMICPRSAHSPQVAAMWRALARSAIQNAGHTTLMHCCERRGFALVTFRGARNKPQPDYQRTAEKGLAKMGVNDLVGFVVEVLVMRNPWYGGYGNFDGAFCVNAADFGINLEQLYREAGGEGDSPVEAADEDEDEEENASARTTEEPAEAASE